MHLLRNPAQAGLKPSLPCVKGGGTACRDGGIVKSDNLHKTIPQSASLTAFGPGRNRRLLPALAKNMPPAYFLNASRPLHKGAFDTRSFYAAFLFAFCSSAKPLWNPATMAGFSLYKKATAEAVANFIGL